MLRSYLHLSCIKNLHYFIIFIIKGQVNTQGAIISHLKEQIEKFRDYKEQVVVLRAEREHLENKVKTLTEKVKYLSTPVCKKIFFIFKIILFLT